MRLVSRETFSRLCKEGYEKFYDDYIRILNLKLMDIMTGRFEKNMRFYEPNFKEILNLDEVEYDFLNFNKYKKDGFNMNGGKGYYLYGESDYGTEFVIEQLYHTEDELIFIETHWRNKKLPNNYKINFIDIKTMFYHNRLHKLYDNYFPQAKIEIEKDKVTKQYNKSIAQVEDILTKLKDIEGCEQEFVDIIIKQCKDRIKYLEELRDKEVEVLE